MNIAYASADIGRSSYHMAPSSTSAPANRGRYDPPVLGLVP